jgi:hypothetical protein
MVQSTIEESTGELQAHNKDCAHHRSNPVELNLVSDDEEEGDVPNPTDPDPNGCADRNLDVLHQLSSVQFWAVMRLVIKSEGMMAAPMPPAIPSTIVTLFVKDAVVFQVADEKLAPRSGRTFEISNAIWHLVQAGVYLILPTLTTMSLQELATNPGCMKTSKGLNAVGSRNVLLDQSMFGKEEDLPENLWHEAWHNQDAIFQAIC